MTPSESNPVEIRPATESDLGALNDIYNHYIRTTTITFDIEPIAMPRRREWFSHYAVTGRHRLFVAVTGSSLLGYATSSQFRGKAAYDTSVETTVYLAPDAGGRGVGTRLYDTLFTALEGEDVHCALAGITLPNPASLALHEKFGFREVGVFTEVGRKFDRFWDVGWYRKALR